MAKTLKIMKKYSVLLVALVALVSQQVQAQQYVNIRGAQDCETAHEIKTPIGLYGPTTTPIGTGQQVDFSGNDPKSLFFLDEEHNTAWYTFKVEQSGYFSFQIIPLQANDDYDFLLYQYDKKDACQQIVNKNIKPVRTNIARNKPELGSLTGLSPFAMASYVHSGPGENFSKGIKVEKGQQFYLVVDNYRDKGKGHSIQFDYASSFDLKGKVTDYLTKEGLYANIQMRCVSTNDSIELFTNPLTGKYYLSSPLTMNQDYVLSIECEGYMFKDTLINTKDLQAFGETSLSFQLDKLEKGKNYVISNLNFESNTAELLKESASAIQRLTTILQKNPSLKIEIEGHTNGVGYEDDPTHMPLSKRRAVLVYNELVKNGISSDRLSYKAYGCTKMLYPTSQDPKEQAANRRVEISVLDF